MRRLLPTTLSGDAAGGAVDLEAAYAWPQTDRQLVRANMVASLDGAATLDGVTEGLSGRSDRRLLGLLRGLADVVLVGAGTVRREGYGPVRPGAERQARRLAAGLAPVPPIAVVSGSLALDPGSRFFVEAVARPIVITHAGAPPDRRAVLEQIADVVIAGEHAADPSRILAALADRGYTRVLCEGGPHLLHEIVAAGRLDELCLTVAPWLVGGEPLRILAGPPLRGRDEWQPVHVLEEGGSLFLRYSRRPADFPAAPPASPASPASP